KRRGIATGLHYTPLPLHPLFAGHSEPIPTALDVYDHMCTLPLHAALTVNPRALQARLSLARLYREAGEKQRGLEELQVAVRLHPGSPEALDEYERALATLEGPVTRQGR
ncbi:MAG: hypothetical protein HY803_08205, partial [candidate division NC10 bacterium]|nr:hypothetical protein [candidate division NC10 bacterium]